MDDQVRKIQLVNLRENPNTYLQEHQAREIIAAMGHTPEANQVNLAEDPRFVGESARIEMLLLAEMKHWDDPFSLWPPPMPQAAEPAPAARAG